MADDLERLDFEQRLLVAMGISREDFEAYKASREYQEWEAANAEAVRIREAFVANMEKRAEELSRQFTDEWRAGLIPADAEVVFDVEPLIPGPGEPLR